ncbi:MAG: hypothetical protein K8S62_10160 [Candidatus Sabulitectum sp.]|nr:hypothetical protein [Candidatus Sabulitectum sp.]
MLRVIILSILLLALTLTLACNSSTEPSETFISQVSVISTSTGSVIAEIGLGYVFNTRIRISSDGNYAYVVSAYGDDQVIQIDCLSQTVSGTLTFGSSGLCEDLCLNDEGTELYALLPGVIYVVDIPSLIVTDTMSLSGISGPPIAHRPGTSLVYVPQNDSLLCTLVIDTELGSVVDTLDFHTWNMAFSETGSELYIYQSGSLICLDPDTGEEIVSTSIEHLSDICLVPGSNTLYVSWWEFGNFVESGVIALDRSTLAVTDSRNVTGGVPRLCYVPGLNQLYITGGDSSIIVADLPGLDLAGEIDIDHEVLGIASSPSGDFVYCSIYCDGSTD